MFISVNDNDKNKRLVDIARTLVALGFTVYATDGTSRFLIQHGIDSRRVYKVNEGRPNVVDHIKNGFVQLVVNTPLGEASRYDELAIGISAIEYRIPVITTVSAAAAAVKGVECMKREKLDVRSIQEYHRSPVAEVLTNAS